MDGRRARRRRRPPRRYRVTSAPRVPWRALWRPAVLALCLAVMLYTGGKLFAYGRDYRRTQQQGEELRGLYLLASQTEPPETSASPAPSPDPRASAPYPLNPYLVVRERFRTLQRQNPDIVGWLSLEGLLGEAVVQRDNSYYLRRDYRGYHNANGAIFLDEQCDLSTRPSALILYGHNMKTGAMFGCLRDYEDVGFYRNNPFITFDTMYEDGRFVIFAVAEVSTDPAARNYSRYYALPGAVGRDREEIIAVLRALSEHTCTIDVDAEDQLLLLVTCVGDEDDRRLIAARRVRDDETEGQLYQKAQQAVAR